MGKSYRKNKQFENNNRSESNDYKRRKNRVKEEHIHDDFSEYKIHGFKNDKSTR